MTKRAMNQQQLLGCYKFVCYQSTVVLLILDSKQAYSVFLDLKCVFGVTVGTMMKV